MKPRIGFLGVGWIGRNRLEAMLGTGAIEVAAICELDRDEARRMIDQTKVSQVLAGARGAKPAKISDVVDVIMRLQRLAVDFADQIAEIDVNPLVVTPSGAVALDALVVRG